MLDYSDLIDSDGFIFFLDYYKAFDTLEHKFLFQALKKIGFGDAFCRMIQMLYINGNSSIKLSNGTSPRFFLKRGVRQGCPVSPYLFLIATEFLSTHINNSQLKAITIGHTKIKICQLADDTALFLNDSSQIPLALDILQSFSKASGFNLNFNKCELLPIKDCSLTSIEDIVVKNRVTYLGILITKDEHRCSANFKPIITKTQIKCNCWLQRDLSLKGRTLLTKAEGLSHLTYAAQSLFVDKPTSKSINEVLIKFLLKNKSHYLRKSVILNTYNNGGLNFIDFDSLNNTFKLNWLNQYLAKPSSIWNVFPQLVSSQLGGIHFLLMCNYDISKLPIKISNFHRQVLLAWALIYKHNFSPQRCFIWNNKNILFKNKSLFYDSWFSNGLFLVEQLFNEQGLLLTYSEFLSKYQIPITPKEFATVFGGIPSGLCTQLKLPY